MVVPAWAGVPVATFGINVVGALLLSVLLELLATRGLDIGWSGGVSGLASALAPLADSPPTARSPGSRPQPWQLPILAGPSRTASAP